MSWPFRPRAQRKKAEAANVWETLILHPNCERLSFFHAAHTCKTDPILAQQCPESAEEGIQRVCHYRDRFTDVRADMVLHKCAEQGQKVTS